MSPLSVYRFIRHCLIFSLLFVLCLFADNTLSAKNRELEPLRLSYLGSSTPGMDCLQHAQPKKKKGKGSRPTVNQESEHRPVATRTYYLNEHRRRATIQAYVRRPNGEVMEPLLRLGYKPSVSFPTPFDHDPIHGPNTVYVVEQGLEDDVLTIRTAKWITMHHNCGWGHDGKFDKNLTEPQPLHSIPFEIVIDKLWDPNFHARVTSGDKLHITILSYGIPVPGVSLTLSSETGWSKRVRSDENGTATIQMIRDYYPPLWAHFKRSHRGEFLVTARFNAAQQGSFRGEAYNHVNYITTLPWTYSPAQQDYASYSFGLALVLLAMTVSGFGIYMYRERRRKPYKGIRFDE